MILFYACLCAVSLVLAAHSKRLLGVVAMFTAFWMLTASDWLPLSPRQVLHWSGVEMAQYQIWAFTDALEALAIIVIGARRWWVFALVSMFCVQEIAHDLYGRFGLYDWATYTGYLNRLFLMQIAVLMVAGLTEGDDVLRSGHRRFRRVRRAVATV